MTEPFSSDVTTATANWPVMTAWRMICVLVSRQRLSALTSMSWPTAGVVGVTTTVGVPGAAFSVMVTIVSARLRQVSDACFTTTRIGPVPNGASSSGVNT